MALAIILTVVGVALVVAYCMIRMAGMCDQEEEEVAYVRRKYCSNCPEKRKLREAQATGNLVWMSNEMKRASVKREQ